MDMASDFLNTELRGATMVWLQDTYHVPRAETYFLPPPLSLTDILFLLSVNFWGSKILVCVWCVCVYPNVSL